MLLYKLKYYIGAKGEHGEESTNPLFYGRTRVYKKPSDYGYSGRLVLGVYIYSYLESIVVEIREICTARCASHARSTEAADTQPIFRNLIRSKFSRKGVFCEGSNTSDIGISTLLDPPYCFYSLFWYTIFIFFGIGF